MPIFKDILAGILGKGEIVDLVKETTDDLIYSKQERAEDQQEWEEKAAEREYRTKELDYEQYNKELEFLQKSYEIEVDDRKDARERETVIIQAAPSKVSWFTVNFNNLLAGFITVAVFGMYYIVLFSDYDLSSEKRELMLYLLGTASSTLSAILMYYFGSTQSSSKKNEIINKMATK